MIAKIRKCESTAQKTKALTVQHGHAFLFQQACDRQTEIFLSAYGFHNSGGTFLIFHVDIYTEGVKGKLPPIIASFAFVVRQTLPPHPNACGLSPHPYAKAQFHFKERNRMEQEKKTETIEKTSRTDKAKTEILRFRVTPEERERIERKAYGSYRTVSRYLRDCALEKEIIVIPGVDALTDELRRIGVNLNQLTRAVNSGYSGVTDLTEITKGVKEIWRSLNSLHRDVR